MRVLIAAARVGSLPARGALDAFAAGWRSGNPDALLDLAVCSSGAHDLLDAVEAVHGGSREVETVVAADGEHEHPVVVLLVAGTAYVQAGDVLDPPLARATTAWTGTSYGVGQIVARAADAGVRRVVVGAGDAATLDLGAGLLAALADAPPGPFDPATALDRLPAWLTTARARLRATELVLAAGTAASVRGLRGA
ncbi:MAG TPA: hypothetical protein DHV14_13915, partial [Micrococcales bacterium]|uniref:glycerate kinase n=3 Tax=Miniimonas TaxID=947525 RepID=UPI000EEB3DFA